MQWIGLFAVAAVFVVMFALGLVLGREQIAAALEMRAARLGNLLLLVLGVMALVDLPSILRAIGWLPSVAGFGMTIVALAVGAAFAGRDVAVRPAAAVAAAMRNPGLALMIATLNHARAGVVEAIIGYAIGLAIAMIVFLQWRKRAGGNRDDLVLAQPPLRGERGRHGLVPVDDDAAGKVRELGAHPDPVEQRDAEPRLGEAVLRPAEMPCPVAGDIERLLGRQRVETEMRDPQHGPVARGERAFEMLGALKVRGRQPAAGAAGTQNLHVMLAAAGGRLERERPGIERGTRRAEHLRRDPLDR